ncbi:MAG: DUF3365 domain-containing protein [Gammaproteobacteria bacterium]|nr:DUF3365 domain-containing protein [Gammaproteobacteria bacterium]
MVNKQDNNPTKKSDKFVTRWLLSYPAWILLITISVSLSWSWNLHTLEQHVLSLALERGRYTFKIIEATRFWLAEHGVAYVARSKATPSNPYLDVPEKNISTPSGIELTAINPAYMTRQLTEILRNKHNLLVHLTSLKPINPGNVADPWETRALTQFEDDEEEKLELIQNNKKDLVRYMAPLYVKSACMECHEKQGYKIGDVRGGISVTFDFAPFLKSTTAQRQNIHNIHMTGWTILSILTVITLRLIRRHELTLEHARDHAEHLVKERTRELQTALDEIKSLKGIIPICSYCHKIRDDEGAWERMESYISKHSDASFSHGICPECMKTARKDAGLDEK